MALALWMATMLRSGSYLFSWILCLMLPRVAHTFLWMVVHTGCSWLSLAGSPLPNQYNTFKSQVPCPQSYSCSGSRRSCTPSGFWTWSCLFLSIRKLVQFCTIIHCRCMNRVNALYTAATRDGKSGRNNF